MIGWELILTSNSVAFSQAWVPAELGWPGVSPATVPPSQLLLFEGWTNGRRLLLQILQFSWVVVWCLPHLHAANSMEGIGFNLSTMLSAYFTYRHEKIFLLCKPFSVITTVF